MAEVCKHGHPQTPENVYERRNGKRECRSCRRRTWNRYRRRNLHVERQRQRLSMKLQRERGGSQLVPAKKCPVGHGEPLYYPIEPFLNWLECRVAEVNADEDMTLDEWARSVWWREDSIRMFLREARAGTRHNVHIDTIDRTLLQAGEIEALEAMYPIDEMSKRGKDRF